MDYEELGRFLARYSPDEWRVFMAGHCGMTQSSNVSLRIPPSVTEWLSY